MRTFLPRTANRAATVAAAVALALAAGCGGPATAPKQLPPSPSPQATHLVDVYYVVDTRAGLRLAREKREVDTDHAVESAVRAMIGTPVDHDYTSTWNPATRVHTASAHNGMVTVDLSAEARQANVGSAGAALMIQQLVYTVTSATSPTDRVLLTIDGEPAGDLWGVVTWNDPAARDDPLNVRQLVQIDSPSEGKWVTSPLIVTGEAAVFEANLPWRVRDHSGRTVTRGNAMTAEGQRFASFRFAVDLPPGAYTVEVSEDDPSGGVAGRPMIDTRTVVVHP